MANREEVIQPINVKKNTENFTIFIKPLNRDDVREV